MSCNGVQSQKERGIVIINMKTRKMKVYGMSDHKWKEVPTIMLKGKWLKEAGFDINNPISVEMVDGKIVISHREEVSFVDVYEERQMCMVAERGVYGNE